MRLMRFWVKAVYIPGKNMHVADVLSRSPLPMQNKNQEEEDVAVHVNSVTSSWPVSDAKLDKIKKETQKDVTLRTAMKLTIRG